MSSFYRYITYEDMI